MKYIVTLLVSALLATTTYSQSCPFTFDKEYSIWSYSRTYGCIAAKLKPDTMLIATRFDYYQGNAIHEMAIMSIKNGAGMLELMINVDSSKIRGRRLKWDSIQISYLERNFNPNILHDLYVDLINEEGSGTKERARDNEPYLELQWLINGEYKKERLPYKPREANNIKSQAAKKLFKAVWRAYKLSEYEL